MPQLVPISGCGGKEPACFLVETGGARLLLDLGYGPEPGVWPDVSGVGRVDALLLSHSHPDHAGALKLLPDVGNPRVYATDIVRRLLPAVVETLSLPLHGTSEVCGVRVTTGRSGHAPGGIWIHLDVGDGLLYMGDCSVESVVYAYDTPPPASTLILDASYGTYDARLADCVPAFDRVAAEGPVLLPVPAAGRGPEIALHFAARKTPHLGDAMRARLGRLVGEDRACLRDCVADRLLELSQRAPRISEPLGVMLASGPDANVGESAPLVAAWENASAPAIVFTGYLPPGTPAERLTKSGRAKYLRWNVHPRLSDNARLVRETRARTVLPAFGDARHLPTWETAFAPAKVMQGPVSL